MYSLFRLIKGSCKWSGNDRSSEVWIRIVTMKGYAFPPRYPERQAPGGDTSNISASDYCHVWEIQAYQRSRSIPIKKETKDVPEKNSSQTGGLGALVGGLQNIQGRPTTLRHTLRLSPRASTSSTAIRQATPISTCSPITLRVGWSATALSISTPRFIGPGCITIESGLA